MQNAEGDDEEEHGGGEAGQVVAQAAACNGPHLSGQWFLWFYVIWNEGIEQPRQNLKLYIYLDERQI